MLSHQEQVGIILTDVFGPISGQRSGSDPNLPEGVSDNEYSRRTSQVAQAFSELREQVRFKGVELKSAST
jgi:hypothetical protein